MLDPKLIICDEPVSALDVSVQAQILNLLEDMKARYGLTMIFIAHDLAVVKNISDRVSVMYLGKMCEVAAADALYRAPAHPYTDLLLTSIPVPDPTVKPDPEGRISGELPSPVVPPSGCRFRTRCPKAAEPCAEEEPQIRDRRRRPLRRLPLPHRLPRSTPDCGRGHRARGGDCVADVHERGLAHELNGSGEGRTVAQMVRVRTTTRPSDSARADRRRRGRGVQRSRPQRRDVRGGRRRRGSVAGAGLQLLRRSPRSRRSSVPTSHRSAARRGDRRLRRQRVVP